MKKIDISLIFCTLLYSYLFYQQSAGINFFLFSLALVACLLLKNKEALTNKAFIASAIGSILTGASVAIYGNALSLFANILSLILSASLLHNHSSSLVFSLFHAAYTYVTSVAFMVMDFLEQKRDNVSRQPYFTKLMVTVLPVLVSSIFFIIYREANPLFKNFTSSINFDFISLAWIAFTLSGAILMYGFFHQQRIDTVYALDLMSSDQLTYERKSENNQLASLNQSGVVLFSLLNLLLLMVNLIDANFLFFNGKLPDGMSYSEFVHQGVFAIILSIVFAIAILLFYFGGDLNFYKRNNNLKALTYLWILQNILLIAATAYKNGLYIHEYSLTYKRIGVFVYLFLCIIGLTTTFLKILQTRSNWFLFRKNAWAFYTVLVLSSFINYDLLITRYNIEQSKSLDKGYLLSLSESVLPELLALEKQELKQNGEITDHLFSQQLHQRSIEFNQNFLGQGWQSWNFENQRIYEQLN